MSTDVHESEYLSVAHAARILDVAAIVMRRSCQANTARCLRVPLPAWVSLTPNRASHSPHRTPTAKRTTEALTERSERVRPAKS
jgi:hypothetical protein